MLVDTLAEYTDSIAIRYVLSDPSWDVLDLVGYFKVDTSAWMPATLTAPSTGLDSSQYTGVIYWDSRQDTVAMSLDADSVRLKVVASDGWAAGGADSTIAIHLDNNMPPTVVFLDSSEELSGDVVLPYELTDAEGDSLTIVIRYSADQGNTWFVPTITGDTTGIINYGITPIWHSYLDLASVDNDSIMLSVVPSDIDTGQGDTLTFHLDNNLPPSITLTAVPGEVRWYIKIPFELIDQE